MHNFTVHIERYDQKWESFVVVILNFQGTAEQAAEHVKTLTPGRYRIITSFQTVAAEVTTDASVQSTTSL